MVRNGCTHLVSSSGGNAGLAAIYCAQQLHLPITVVVPETTPSFIAEKMREEGATVEIVGKVMFVSLATGRLICFILCRHGMRPIFGHWR